MSNFPLRKIRTDVVVCGGGLGGVCAAIAAARTGAKTLLIQDRSVLGGNASSEIRVQIGGACEGGYHFDARESGIIEEIRLETGVRDPENINTWIDTVLYSFCREEPNLTVLLNTTLTGATTDQDRILTISAIQLASELRYEIEATMFVDGTGDGTLGFLAGAEYRIGREAQAEFQEHAAPLVADSHTLGASILLRAVDQGHPVDFQPPKWVKRFTKADLRSHSHYAKAPNAGKYWHGESKIGWWWVELGGMEDSIHDNDKIRHDLQAIVFGIWDYIKNIDPLTKEDAANFDIAWIGQIPGKRESRRLIGDYILTESDLLAMRIFPDQIAVGGWSMDLHPPAGFYATTPGAEHTYMDLPYSIPFRCIYSKNIANLLIGSRCLSVSHVAHGSTRLIATLACIGQAAGTAAAYCVAHQITPRALYLRDLPAFQQLLVREDQYLLGIRNQDPNELCHDATIRATSEYPCSFGSPTTFVPVNFPMAQRFYLSPFNRANGKPDQIPEIRILVENTTDHIIQIAGALRQDPDRLEFAADTDLCQLMGEINAHTRGWVTLQLSTISVAAKLQNGGNFWVYLKEQEGLGWGLNRWHFPGFRIGYFHEEQERWQTLRGDHDMFYNKHIGPRGHFCFTISNVGSPFPATALLNGEGRPFVTPNIWISAPRWEDPFEMHPPYMNLAIPSSPRIINASSSSSGPSSPTAPSAQFPVEIILEWARPISMHTIQFTFDTDLDNSCPHNNIGSFKIKDWPIGGKAPTCIRELKVWVVYENGQRDEIGHLHENYQRRAKISFNSPVVTQKLVIQPISNWGFTSFNLYEIRIVG